MAGEFIIRVKYGGLGDHLFLSHLPRIAKQSGGYKRVLISKQSDFRNESYKDLVWGLNPYVDGFCDEDAPYPEFATVEPGMNLLDRIMLERGLDDDIRFHEPEIYYSPRTNPEFVGKTVYDPNFVSGVGEVDVKSIEAYFAANGGLDFQLIPRGSSFPVTLNAKVLRTESLQHYCDIIFSAGKFACLTSGGATLAAALRKPATAFYGRSQKVMFHHSKLHEYVDASAGSNQGIQKTQIASDLNHEIETMADELRQCFDFDQVRVALDLGSRDGQVAVKLKSLFTKAVVYAFECNPAAINLCKANLHGISGISLVENAVSDESGTIAFFAIDPSRTITPHLDGNIGASSLFQARSDYPMEKYVQNRIQVNAVTLADWVAKENIENIDFIWMDLQGAELKALRGLGDRISTVRAIYTEVAYQPIYHDQPLAAEIDSYLRSHGFFPKKTLYQDTWMGNVLYVRDAQLKAQAHPEVKHNAITQIAVNCKWKPAATVLFPELNITLRFNPPINSNVDFVLDLDESYSAFSESFPPDRRIYATTEPSKRSRHTEQSVSRLADYYGKLILSWHPELKTLPQCRPWNAVERWKSELPSDTPKQFGIGGIFSPKNDKNLEGYTFRMEILTRQNEIKMPGCVYNFQKSWKGCGHEYPRPTKDDSLRYMFHLAIENSVEEGYFTEKIIDAFASKCVPLYFGHRSIGDVFDASGIIFLDRKNFVEQINSLTEYDYVSRLDFINSNFERSKEFWSMDRNLARALSRELRNKNASTISENSTRQRQASSLMASNQPVVSICIITNSGLSNFLNRREYLDRLLRSIPHAGFPSQSTEVIVCGAVGRSIPSATILEHPELASSGQVCALRNFAVKTARGKLIIHCDDDILFTPGYWEQIAKSSKDKWDILCTRLLNPNGTRYWDWAAFYPGKGQTLLPYDAHDEFTYATGGHANYRKSVFDKLKWNETLRHGDNEEFDIAAQARNAGLRFAICPDATVFLQYPHCDALAAVTGSEARNPTAETEEFRRIVKMIDGNLKTRPSDVLYSRIKHKFLDSPSQVNSPTVPDVSIVVCCYRYLQRLRFFAQSLCRQDYDSEKVEVVVANPKSPDGLSEYLATLGRAKQTGGNNNRIPKFCDVIVSEEFYRNRGYLIQKGFENTKGKIVVGMDCDLILPADFISKIVEAVSKNPNRVIGVYRNFLSPKTTDAILAGIIDPWEAFNELLQEDENEEKGYRGVLGYCQAATRSAWEQAGGYPVEFDQIAQSDVTFIDRLREKEIEPMFLKDCRVLHLHHPRNWNGTTESL